MRGSTVSASSRRGVTYRSAFGLRERPVTDAGAGDLREFVVGQERVDVLGMVGLKVRDPGQGACLWFSTERQPLPFFGDLP